MEGLTPQIARTMTGPTKKFLVPIGKSVELLSFTHFIIRDVDEDNILYEYTPEIMEDNVYADDDSRIMSYQFYPDYFDIPCIGITKQFKTGKQPIRNLLCIDRFYFRDILISSNEFVFPFCIPLSTNTWEQMYDMPRLSEKLQQQMILNSWETKKDTFYFVDDVLILHERAEYDFNGGQSEID